MTRSKLSRTSIRATTTAFTLALLLAGFTTSAAAQGFQVLHNFTFGVDGAEPWATVTVDQRGNLYGTTLYGGANNRGTVFKLAHQGSSWVFSPLYSFTTSDGVFTEAPLAIGPDGTLFGTTVYGGTAGIGTVYNVHPQSNPCRSVLCPWTETVLHSFAGQPDGSEPGYGALVFDAAGIGYGTTTNGGANSGGVVYELARSQQGWTENVAYSLSDLSTGTNPYGGVIFDGAGNLYGTASSAGGNGAGAVYQLSPSGSGWTGMFLYTFPVGDPGAGEAPYGGVIFDAAGNFYGTTTAGGSNGQGTVYELTPSGGSWTESVLYSFGGTTTVGPKNSLTMDAAGNLYGTTFQGGAYQGGAVFRLSPSNGEWIYSDLHDFTGGEGGQFPIGGVAIDTNGNLFGTAEIGGNTSGNCYPDGCGIVWEITP